MFFSWNIGTCFRCLLVALGLQRLHAHLKDRRVFHVVQLQVPKVLPVSLLHLLLLTVLLAGAAKTVVRNEVWESRETLFRFRKTLSLCLDEDLLAKLRHCPWYVRFLELNFCPNFSEILSGITKIILVPTWCFGMQDHDWGLNQIGKISIFLKIFFWSSIYLAQVYGLWQ